MDFTLIWIAHWNQLWKSFKMISISPTNSRIRGMKIDFLTFAWAKLYVGSPGKFRGYSQKIPYWIWNILILILWVLLTAVIWFRPKNRPKNGFYGGWNCVGWHEIKWIALILYIKFISVKSWTLWVILRIKHPRIWTPPTHFQKFCKIFEIEFPGFWTKVFISPESA